MSRQAAHFPHNTSQKMKKSTLSPALYYIFVTGSSIFLTFYSNNVFIIFIFPFFHHPASRGAEAGPR